MSLVPYLFLMKSKLPYRFTLCLHELWCYTRCAAKALGGGFPVGAMLTTDLRIFQWVHMVRLTVVTHYSCRGSL